MSIIHALLRWILGVLAPGTGRRRAGACPDGPGPAHRRAAPRLATPRPPAQPSPYAHDVPLDGSASALVRPYVIAADFGIYLDRDLIGAEGVA